MMRANRTSAFGDPPPHVSCKPGVRETTTWPALRRFIEENPDLQARLAGVAEDRWTVEVDEKGDTWVSLIDFLLPLPDDELDYWSQEIVRSALDSSDWPRHPDFDPSWRL